MEISYKSPEVIAAKSGSKPGSKLNFVDSPEALLGPEALEILPLEIKMPSSMEIEV